MPSCAAQECSNSWKKGYKMCSFPIKNTERCAIWVHNVNCPNWIPSRHSALCQIHFAPEMWEQHRTDGLLKLKRNAIPTLFGKTVPEELIIRKMENRNTYIPIKDFAQSENLFIQENSSEINENRSMENEDINYTDTDITIETIKIEDGGYVQLNEVLNLCTNCLQKEKKIEEMHKIFTKVDRLHKYTKQKLLIAKRKIKHLQRQVLTASALVINVKKILDDSQVKLLSGEFKKVPIWCTNTIQKAMRLKLACGSTGYEEVIRNFPLPSLRTLNRRIKRKV